ncbi:Retrovirus-related Pol polyprotein [Thelohanellus kitauei]|uniref:Retrovirus-related Pol polyprotein n=1 Tax=Thelohanellus kitauei TaxID=669202 RepID=A0A0C2J8H1_THEKT|nr:Retrovirus-related Pol polyprotein [Thelohanellus kitauei]
MNDKTIEQFMNAKNSTSGPIDLNADPLTSMLIRQEHALTIKNGILSRKYDSSNYKSLRLVLPKSLIPHVMKLCHYDRGHPGYINTLNIVRNRFYWPKLRKDIQSYCEACRMCASRNNRCPKIKARMIETLSDGIFDRIAIDIMGPLPTSNRGNKYVSVVSDYLSKC